MYELTVFSSKKKRQHKMDSGDALLALLLLIDEDSEDEDTDVVLLSAKKRKCWVKPWVQKYGSAGPYETVWQEWREIDPERYRRTLRYNFLLRANS
jgi:hypothetical protein